jgi:uncharacterized protein
LNRLHEYIVISLAALLGSGLTFFSGFGLGTILAPVFALFFPVELAIALTAIVHFLNNIFKLLLVGKHADLKVVLKFGLPSLVAAFAGALALSFFSDSQPLITYNLFGKICEITVLKLVIAVVLVFFVLMDLVPRLANITFDRRYMVAGGLLSGFFGGLSGNQGALRSAFLIKAGLDKESFIATGVVIACMVDISRLAVYAGNILDVAHDLNYSLLVAATLSAFIGAFAGSRLVKKITIRILQYIVGALLLLFAILLGAGVL